MDDYRTVNRAYWDQLASFHPKTPFYRTDAFRRGENVLDAIVREGLGDITGKRIIHLQCHFGLDTLSLARMGAETTGVDFSSVAIAAARTLARETNVRAEFIEADVLALPAELRDFDIAFASWGALIWIADLALWMRNAARTLKPGGRLFLAEGHPALNIFADRDPPDAPLRVGLPYSSAEPFVEEIQGSYADLTAILQSPKTVSWAHGLERIFNAAIDAGFTIRKFRELDRVPWAALPQLVKADTDYWTLPKGTPFIPLSFTLDAELSDRRD